MKQIGLRFFGKERSQPVLDITTNGLISQTVLSEKERKEVEDTPLISLLQGIQYNQRSLLRAINSDRGVEISSKILSSDEIWQLYESHLYSPVLDTFKAMIVNGAGDLLVEAAYKRKDQMRESQFTQIARFAAYSSGGIDEFANHPLISTDEKWKSVVNEGIANHLKKHQVSLETRRETLFEHLIKTDQTSLKAYIDTLNLAEASFLLNCVKGADLNLEALPRFIQGSASVLEFTKNGSRLQLFRDFSGETYLVNTVPTEPAESWNVIAEKLPEMTVPYLKETAFESENRIYSEYAGLSTDGWDSSDLPIFLNTKLEKLVDNVVRSIRQLGYRDHRTYLNNYCYYFVDKSSGIPTTDFEKVYKNLVNFRIVVKRIDLDAMKKFK
jgi:hypothetical protein